MKILTVLFLLLFAAAVSAGSASGTFTLDGKQYEIKSVLARTDENPFDEKKKDIVILLTDNVPSDTDFDSFSVNKEVDAGKLHGIMVSLDDEKKPYSLTILGVAQKSGTGLCTFDSKKFEPAFVSGRIYADPEKSFDHTYEFDIQFETAVVDQVGKPLDAEGGTPLPPGGGEPGKAYLEFDKAIQSGDVAFIKKMAPSEEEAAMLDSEEGKAALEMMKALRTSNVKIVQGFVNGDRATLIAEGISGMTGSKTTGTIRMIRVNGTWRVEKEQWK